MDKILFNAHFLWKIFTILLISFLALWFLFVTPLQAKNSNFSKVDNAVKEFLFPWQPKIVKTANGKMKIVTKERRVTEKIYTAMMPMVCLGISDTKSESLIKEILVLNIFEKQGWVYETPKKCSKMIKIPVGKINLFILGDSHLK